MYEAIVVAFQQFALLLNSAKHVPAQRLAHF